MKIVNAANRPHHSGYMRPVIFGHQKWMPAHVRHHHAADHDVVEVGDDEIGVGHVHVDRERREEQPGQPADREQADEAERVEHRRVSSTIEPLYIVAVQLKTLIADGMATMKLRTEKIMPA